VKFWETRAGSFTECAAFDSVDPSLKPSTELPRQIMGKSHPVHELRVRSLRDELTRWETERQSVMASLQAAGGVAGAP
jgi:hypothetical protein